MTVKKRWLNLAWCLLILGFLGVNFYAGIKRLPATGLSRSRVENASSMEVKMPYIDFNGFMARLLGQKILNDVVLADDGVLYRLNQVSKASDMKEEEKAAEAVDRIYALSREINAEFLYAQRPWKHNEADVFPYGFCSSIEGEQFRLRHCREQGEPCLDLRGAMGDSLDFYITDHHWKVASGLAAAAAIENALGHGTDKLQTELYHDLRWEKCFLGSQGIRTGRYFAGIDDMIVPVPDFATDFHYEHYIKHELKISKEGAFDQAFLDHKRLDDKNYYDKYGAILNNSYVETIIVNHKADNEKKILVIADSYGRALCMYLALNYRETRYLDPQKGRYNDNYLEYIKAYSPDVIVVATPIIMNVE